MTTHPAVSVVIPTYNRAHLLPRALKSVQAQTMDDLEIIVVDDASRDATEKRVHAFADRRIRYLRHACNRGGPAARNTGIGHARAPLVAFLDADDEWLPAKLQQQCQAFRRRPEAVLVHTRYAIYEAGQDTPARLCDPAPACSRHTLLRTNGVGTTSVVMARRDVLKKIGGFDEALPSCQDWDAWLRLSLHGTLVCVPVVLAKYHHLHGGPHQISARGAAVVAGREAFLAKHRSAIAAEGRRLLAWHHFRLGQLCCHHMMIPRARHHFLRALRHDPLDLRAHLFLAATAFGLGGYRAVRHVWRAARRARDAR